MLAMHQSMSLPATTVQKKNIVFRGPYKWVIAIVGPQLQDLHSISRKLSKISPEDLNSSNDINLVRSKDVLTYRSSSELTSKIPYYAKTTEICAARHQKATLSTWTS